MSTHSGLDRESFQTLLASAFAVQESGMDPHSLSALVEVQASITKGQPDFDAILELIAERARIVAGATGIVIGLLTGDRLQYRAGSGSAAKHVGRRVTAMLSLSDRNRAQKEILRVENAEIDPRIEGAICRQYEAKALLIVPIYREHTLAGVLEVLFSEAHTFQDREVRFYQFMAGLVEDAMPRDTEICQKSVSTAHARIVQQSIAGNPPQMQEFCSGDKPGSDPSVVHCAAAVPLGNAPAPLPRANQVTTIEQPVKRTFPDDLRWRVAAAAIVIALGVMGWISLDHRDPLTRGGSAITRSNASSRHLSDATAKPSPAGRPSKPQNAKTGTNTTNAVRHPFKRVQVAPNEVDYIAKDVTIRHFITNTAPSPALSASTQFNIGDDVTVRYFVYKPQVGPKTQPVSTAVQSKAPSVAEFK